MAASVVAPQLAGAQRWYTPSEDLITWRVWDDEFVVHVGSRAATHLLSATAGTVLLGLLDASLSLTLDALFERVLGGPLGVAMTDDERASLLGIVLDFERLGLATRSVT